MDKLNKLDMLDILQEEISCLRKTVSTMEIKVTELTKDNNELRASMLDLQVRSMRNLIFTGIVETPNEDTEEKLKNFLHREMNIPKEDVEAISFARSHRLGRIKTFAEAITSRPTSKAKPQPRPIIVKFDFFKQREMIRRLAPRLK